MRRPATSFLGATLGALLTAPLLAVFYLAEQVFGLPFPPFAVFDWLARTLPGDIVVRSIEAMVDIIRRFDLGETSGTAKTLETLAALLIFFGGGVLAAMLLLVWRQWLAGRGRLPQGLWPGGLAGMLVSVPVVAISLDVGDTDTAPGIVAIWLLLAFAVWGALLFWLAERWPEPQPAELAAVPPLMARPLSRREFLIRVGSASATLTVIGAGVGRYLEVREERNYQALVRQRRAAAEAVAGQVDLPNRDDPVIPVPGTRPEYTPLEDHYRIDINVRAQELDAATWRLRIGGLVERPLELTLDEIVNDFSRIDRYVTLSCISNPIGGDLISTTRWTGAPLGEVLARAGVQPQATHLRISSADGFYETVALDLVRDDPRLMLTYAWDGIPLLHEHGYPLRLYIPDRYGMKQPKWITEIEAIAGDEDGYWVARGWDREARVRATAVIDVVADDLRHTSEGMTLVPIGGIAYAGARGISAVKVRVDDGPWQPAQLRQPLSDTTWVLWRYEWPFVAGRHTFTVRCREADGTPQIEARAGTFPSGATGYHDLTRTL
jgi:DMSO/TMAO reductase YedYZ molybdopterin-dependent catalytic subunit